MKKKKSINHIWWIIPTLIILFFIIFIIFYFTKDNGICLSDWLIFVGSYLGFAGSVILGYVAIYQNRRLRDDNELRHKNAIKPDIEIINKTLHILNIVDMREYFHHLKLHKEMDIEYTNIIPRDIRALYKEFRVLTDISSDRSITDKEYNKLDNHYRNSLSKSARKYLLLDFYLENNGNGNAINIDFNLNGEKISIKPSLQSNKTNVFLFLVEISTDRNDAELQIILTYQNIDNEKFTKNKNIKVARNIAGQLTITED